MTADRPIRHVIMGLDRYPRGAVLELAKAQGAEILDVTLGRAMLIRSTQKVVNAVHEKFPLLTIAPEREF